MKVIDLPAAVRDAVSATPTRPATAALHDTPAVRLVVFRIAPGQAVAPHTNPGTVILTVLSGRGIIVGGEESRDVSEGHVVAYAPGELHAMQATDQTLSLLATIIHSH